MKTKDMSDEFGLPPGWRIRFLLQGLEDALADGPESTEDLNRTWRLPRKDLVALLRTLQAEGLIYENTKVREGWWVPVPGGPLDDREPLPTLWPPAELARRGMSDRYNVLGTTGMSLVHRVMLRLAQGYGRDRTIAEELEPDAPPGDVERVLRDLEADGLAEETDRGRIMVVPGSPHTGGDGTGRHPRLVREAPAGGTLLHPEGQAGAAARGHAKA